jgi:hypothetical protein
MISTTNFHFPSTQAREKMLENERANKAKLFMIPSKYFRKAQWWNFDGRE